MNWGSILSLILQLAVPTVLTVESIAGQATAGADKKTMAETALAGATQAALSVLPSGSQNAAYAQAAAGLASVAIDAAVAFTKTTGAYQNASAKAVTTTQPSTPATK